MLPARDHTPVGASVTPRRATTQSAELAAYASTVGGHMALKFAFGRPTRSRWLSPIGHSLTSRHRRFGRREPIVTPADQRTVEAQSDALAWYAAS
jgi:hypothetical protein